MKDDDMYTLVVLLYPLINQLIKQMEEQPGSNKELVLIALISSLAVYAAKSKASGLSVVKQLCDQMDSTAGAWEANGDITADFADWFVKGIPVELLVDEKLEFC